ncbi:MAG: winged helix-turn-helix transcriptional regulator [Candidatus Acidiferrales bacterium]
MGVAKGKDCAGPCPIHGLLELLARPWTLHIIWALGTDGPSRFGVLRRRVGGISSRVLTERLRVLEQKGFVYRHYQATIPPAVTYGLTKRVNDVQRVLKGLNQLAQQWQEEDATPERPRKPARRSLGAGGAAPAA